MIIVGAGIAGLRVGIKTLKKSPNLRCCILEKYNYNGGRIVTYFSKLPTIGKIQWENGAGRISTSHTRVLELLDKYKLTFVPIPTEVNYNMHSNNFIELFSIFLEPLYTIPTEILQMHTLKQLLHKLWGSVTAKNFYSRFPYYSEIHVLRADIALESFRHEMGTTAGFGKCKEGLSTLIKCMVDEFESLGGVILHNTEVTSLLRGNASISNASISNASSSNASISITCNTPEKKVFYTNKCVLALHCDAIRHIRGVQHMDVLKKLTMQPLLRMYAVFPVRKGVSWFSDIPTTVTNSPLRYIIPINPQKGIIMISYTEGKDASYWMNHTQIEKNVMKEIRSLYSDHTIPDPTFFKMHSWDNGTTYWLPGDYSVEKESINALHPLPQKFPGLFMCGESFAVNQAWMESALEHADMLLEYFEDNAL